MQKCISGTSMDAYTLSTECCALNMLRASNKATLEELTAEVKANKAPHFNKKIQGFVKEPKGIGARALFCIVTYHETKLAANLITLGFKPVFEFGRRRGYGGGTNTMYCLNW